MEDLFVICCLRLFYTWLNCGLLMMWWCVLYDGRESKQETTCPLLKRNDGTRVCEYMGEDNG